MLRFSLLNILVSILETPILISVKYRVLLSSNNLQVYLDLLMNTETSPSPSWRLKLRNDLHLARKTWHCGMGVFMALVYGLGTPKVICVFLLLGGLSFFLTAEYARLRFPRVNSFAIKAMGPIMRKNEENKMSGTPFYIGSVLLSVLIFPKAIAILSILFLAIGDPISSIFGITWGHKLSLIHI